MNLCDINDRIDAFTKRFEIDAMDIGDLRELLNWIRGMADGLRQATKKELEDARDQYQRCDVQIDDDAMTSASDQGGVWVQAWVYVYPVEEA